MPAAPSPSCVHRLAARPAEEPARIRNDELLTLGLQPWTLRVGQTPLVVRPSTARDLAAVAHLHARCSARTLLDRYRSGGRPPAVAALDRALRAPFGIVAATSLGEVLAVGTVTRDERHSHLCAELGLLVRDDWQRLGIGAELVAHLAGIAQAAGFHELIAYPATAVTAAQRLMVDVGRTRMVPGQAGGTNAHLHTYLPESAMLGLGAVRQRLAG